jgi:tetratricopeptide (TPR) repeat protein
MQRKRTASLFILTLVVALAGCGKDPEVAKREFMKSGQQYFANGKYKEAVIEFRNAVQQDPRFGEARFALAGALLKTSDVQGAYREYARAADLLPNDIEAQMWAGEMNLLAARFDDARTLADKALSLDPKSVRAQLIKANALAGLKQFDAAVDEAQDALGFDPSNIRTYKNLAVLQFAKGDRDAAEKSFKQVVNSEPRSMEARVALANFYWSTGKRDVAETSLKEALTVEPNSTEVNRALAALYLASGRVEQAEAPLKLVAAQAKNAPSMVALADYYRNVHRDAEALTQLDKAAADPQTFATATVRKAAILYAQGKKNDAYAALDSVLKQDETNTTALVLKSQFLAQDGKLDEGLTAAQKAASANPGSAPAHFAVGRIQEAKSRMAEAIAAYNETLKISPGAADAQLGLARVYLATGRTGDALHFTQQLVSSQRENQQGLLLHAAALLAQRDLQAAEAALKTVITLNPQSAQAHAELGMLYGIRSETAKSRAEYERALALDPGNLDALGGMTVLDVAQRNPAPARARLQNAVAKNPDSTRLLILAARSFMLLNDAAETERLLRRVVDVDPSVLGAYAMLGQLYVSQQRTDQAIKEFDQLLARNPRSVGAHTMLGLLLGAQNKREDAKRHYEQAIAIDERAAVASNNLAWLYLEDGGNLDLALQLAQSARHVLPDSPEVGDTLGWIYFKKGLTDQAVTALRETVGRQPERADFNYHLGLALAKNGDARSARETLEKALRLDPKSSEAQEARTVLTQLPAGS